MIPEWLQKLLTDGIEIPVKLVITPEIDPSLVELLENLGITKHKDTGYESPLNVKVTEVTDEMKTRVDEYFTRNESVHDSTLGWTSKDFCTQAHPETVEKPAFSERRKLNKLKYDRSGNVVKCPHCGSDSIIKKGKLQVGGSAEQRFCCLDCGHCFFAGSITYRSLPAEEWIKLTDKLEWQEYEGRIVIHYSDSIVLSSWYEMEKLSKLSEEKASDEISNLYIKNSQKRTAIRTFLKAFIDGVVCKEAEASTPDFGIKKFWPLPGFPDVTYQEPGNDVLVLRYNGAQIKTTWPEVIELSQYMDEELNKKVHFLCEGSFDKCVALKEFVKAYQEERVRDPDAFCRPVLSTITRPDDNSGKVESLSGE